MNQQMLILLCLIQSFCHSNKYIKIRKARRGWGVGKKLPYSLKGKAGRNGRQDRVKNKSSQDRSWWKKIYFCVCVNAILRGKGVEGKKWEKGDTGSENEIMKKNCWADLDRKTNSALKKLLFSIMLCINVVSYT